MMEEQQYGGDQIQIYEGLDTQLEKDRECILAQLVQKGFIILFMK